MSGRRISPARDRMTYTLPGMNDALAQALAAALATPPRKAGTPRDHEETGAEETNSNSRYDGGGRRFHE